MNQDPDFRFRNRVNKLRRRINELENRMSTNETELVFEPNVQATVTIDVKDLLRSTCSEYDSSDNDLGNQIRKEVIDSVAEKASKEIMSMEFKKELREIIREKVSEEVEHALCGEYQPTNAYGTPEGQPTSLRAGIDKHIAKWANERSERYTSATNMNVFIKNEVNRRIEEDLHGVLAELRNGVREATKGRISSAIADIVSGIK